MDNVLDAIREIDPDLIILDSIQTFSLAEFCPRAQATRRRPWNVRLLCGAGKK